MQTLVKRRCCPVCRHWLTTQFALNGERAELRFGDLAVCRFCGFALVVTATLEFRRLLEVDIPDLNRETLELLLRSQIAVRKLRHERGKNRWSTKIH